MTTSVRGQTVLRMPICSHRTTLEDIDLVFRTLRALGEKIDRQERGRLKVPR